MCLYNSVFGLIPSGFKVRSSNISVGNPILTYRVKCPKGPLQKMHFRQHEKKSRIRFTDMGGGCAIY